MKIRQKAEKDLTDNRMVAEIKSTIEFLEDTKNRIKTEIPSCVNNFQYNLLSAYTIYCAITGVDGKIYLTNYLNKRQGLESPTLIIEKTSSNRSLYAIYKEEFEFLWKKSQESSTL